jgi:hypothetical protein
LGAGLGWSRTSQVGSLLVGLFFSRLRRTAHTNAHSMHTTRAYMQHTHTQHAHMHIRTHTCTVTDAVWITLLAFLLTGSECFFGYEATLSIHSEESIKPGSNSSALNKFFWGFLLHTEFRVRVISVVGVLLFGSNADFFINNKSFWLSLSDQNFHKGYHHFTEARGDSCTRENWIRTGSKHPQTALTEVS